MDTDDTQDSMEQWEIQLRARLNEELTDGPYVLQAGSTAKTMTGKGGKIEYEVALQKHINEELANLAYIEDTEVTLSDIPAGSLTEDELNTMLFNIFLTRKPNNNE